MTIWDTANKDSELANYSACVTFGVATKKGGDKVMRLHSQTGRIASGVMLLPENANWLQEYLAELLSFPNSRYDDQVDATVYALEHRATASHYGCTDEGLRNYATIFDNTDVHPLANLFNRFGLF